MIGPSTSTKTRAGGLRNLALVAALGASFVSAAGCEIEGKPAEKPSEKSARPSSVELGKLAPGFELSGLDGRPVRLSDFEGRIVVLQWMNPACPYCQYAFSDEGPLPLLVEPLRAKDVVWLSIVSENPANPGGRVDDIRKFAAANGLEIPVLLDPDGRVGKLYGAKTTPEEFIVSEKGVLVYRGALDNAPLGKREKSDPLSNYVSSAISDLTTGRAVIIAQMKAYGTPIQYARL